MAQFTLTIPNGLLQEILNAFEYQYPIPVDTDDVPVMTQAQNAKLQVRRYVRDIYTAYNATTASDAARDAAIMQAEIDSAPIEVT